MLKRKCKTWVQISIETEHYNELYSSTIVVSLSVILPPSRNSNVLYCVPKMQNCITCSVRKYWWHPIRCFTELSLKRKCVHFFKTPFCLTYFFFWKLKLSRKIFMVEFWKNVVWYRKNNNSTLERKKMLWVDQFLDTVVRFYWKYWKSFF